MINIVLHDLTRCQLPCAPHLLHLFVFFVFVGTQACLGHFAPDRAIDRPRASVSHPSDRSFRFPALLRFPTDSHILALL